MIPEPQRTYVLELLNALGPAAEDFIVAGAQAMRFTVEKARATKDVDFLLNVLALRREPLRLAPLLESLGYQPVSESRNFQFAKPIPGGAETMRIEFMAPDEYKREKDFRVDIQDGVHARACTGGTIAVTQSNLHPISGKLPNGTAYTANVRVIRPHALVMLKLLALADRYANIRGPKEARHDREEAQTHAADIVAIVTALPDIAQFNKLFAGQFAPEPLLGVRLVRCLADFFRDVTSPGLLVYTEYLAANLPTDRATPELLRQQTDLGRRIVAQILPPREFLALASAVDDATTLETGAPLVEEFLSTLENVRISVSDPLALQSLPTRAFGGAYQRGATLVGSAPEPLQKMSEVQQGLLRSYLQAKVNALRTNEQLRRRFPHTLKD